MSVDYSRQRVREYLPKKKELELSDYEEFDKKKIQDWLDKLPDKVTIEVSIEENCEGFGYSREVVRFAPFTERTENDKEYLSRIEKEEEEEERMKRTIENEEYQRDMEEYERIKEKYGL